MGNLFDKLQVRRNDRKKNDQEKRNERSNKFDLQRKKRYILTIEYSAMVLEILEQLRDALYPGIPIEEDPWECRWYLYRPIKESGDKKNILSVTLKLNDCYEPQYFQCERYTDKFDFQGGPHHYSESKSLTRKELIKALNKLHPSGTV